MYGMAMSYVSNPRLQRDDLIMENNLDNSIEVELNEDRYSRLRLIPWWDQDRLKKAKILVVGAGALGNEILKNLALIGVGHIVIVDLDKIENSNLSRSILFRSGDEGRMKAEVAAERIHEINPDIHVTAIAGNVVTDIGLGLFRWADFIIGGLDNREARLFLNRACWRTNRPYIDGAIEALQGFARVFLPPDGACYECTLSETDWQLLDKRRSCSLLSRDEMLEGKTPTTPTSASIIAGIEVQEMLKLLHHSRDLPVLAGKCFVFNGLTHDSYIIEYQKKDDCMSHETYTNIEEMEIGAENTTIRTIIELINARLGSGTVLELNRDIVSKAQCLCGYSYNHFKPIDALSQGDGECPECGRLLQLDMFHIIDGHEDFIDRSLSSIGVPLFDILTGRKGDHEIHFELSADKGRILKQEANI